MNINIKNRPDVGVSDIDFLRAIKGGEKEITYFRMIQDHIPDWQKSKICKTESSTLIDTEDEYGYERTTFKRYQKKGYGIFFVVQSGGQKNTSIKKINAQILDFDFGKVDTGEKDAEGKTIWQYKTEAEVEESKQKCMQRLCMFSLEPSIVVETKNGFHVYWLVDQTAPYKIEKYRSLELAMVAYFKNADPKVCDLAHVLRVVQYLHQKDPEHPFKIKTIYFNPKQKVTQQQMCTAIGVQLDALEDEVITKKNKDAVQQKITDIKATKTDKNAGTAEVAADVYTVVQVKPELQTTFYNYPDLLDYIKKQNMIPVLRQIISGFPAVHEGEMFCCVFHPDTNPSAKIWQTKQGYYKYMCFGNCTINAKGEDIIGLVMKIKQYDFQESIKYLCQTYNCKLVTTKWIDTQTEKYKQNFSFRFDQKIAKDMKDKYPYFYSIMDRGGKNIQGQKITTAWAIWEKIQGIGIAHIHPAYQFQHQSIVFFSNRFIQDLTGIKNVASVNKYINLLATLGLITKIKEENIPSKMLQRAQKEKNDTDDKIICFYAINNIFDIVKTAEERAKKMISTGFSIRGMSKKYVIAALGPGVAEEIYGKVIISKYTVRKMEAIQKVMMNTIKKKNYFCYADIKNAIIPYTQKRNGQRLYVHEWEKERLYKTCAGELMQHMPIQKQRLDSKLKDKLRVKDKGYAEVYFIEPSKKII